LALTHEAQTRLQQMMAAAAVGRAVRERVSVSALAAPSRTG